LDSGSLAFPAPWDAVVNEANIPTVADHLIALAQGHFTRPDVAARIKPLEAAWQRTFRGFFERADAALQLVAESPPSPGYEPWLIRHGYSPIIARITAALVVRRGNRIAKESARLPAAVDAIRFLATPGRNRRAIARKVKVLLAAWNETSVMDTIFKDTDLDVFEFVRVLKTVVKGDELACARLTELATALAPHLTIPRGPKISAESAAHEFFLEEAVIPMERRAYTWNDVDQDFTDAVTQATRLEFGDGEFDPRPARRRLKNERRQ